MQAFGLAPLLLFLPFIGFLINGLVGKKFTDHDQQIGERWTGWLAVTMAVSAFGIAVLQFFSLRAHEFHAQIIPLFDWINIPSAGLNIPWAMQIDTLSVTMMLVVTGVGSLIHIYAIGYMHGDKSFYRFFAFLNLFLFFMLILVTGNNYLMLFVGWEGVGLCSFLLIGFWFDKSEKDSEGVYIGVRNSDAARKAMIANRVGDFAMILAMILTFWSFGSMSYQPVFANVLEIFESGEMIHFAGTGLELQLGWVLTAITGLFLMGATGKSAQVPLFVWLPDAMAGPTPVSALIHAATMVTSGIYLIVRSNVLFEVLRQMAHDGHFRILGLINVPDLVAAVGAITAVYAGFIAFTQFDVKKVLAYSTVSQLGFMIAAAGMGAYVAAMFHLITHAFFKALLFMGSGSIIHGMEHGHHEIHDHHGHEAGTHDPHGHKDEHPAQDRHADFDPQDMRTMGGLRHKMPVTFAVYMFGTLALAGIFPFAGFWSKDEILAHASTNSGMATFVYWMLTIAAVCTAFYMGRQIKMVFFGKPRHAAAEHAHESPALMTAPLVVLAALSLLGGLLNFPHIGPAPEHGGGGGAQLALEHWLEHSIQSFELTEEAIVHMPHTPTSLQMKVAIISSVLAIGALAGAFYGVYGNRPTKATDTDPLQRTPIWAMSILPLNTLYMDGVVPAFNRLSMWLGHRFDWDFWHDWFHNNVIRQNFIRAANFVARVLDGEVIDGGLVMGTSRLVKGFSGALRQLQSGFVRNYALSVFVGVVALLAYFIFGA